LQSVAKEMTFRNSQSSGEAEDEKPLCRTKRPWRYWQICWWSGLSVSSKAFTSEKFTPFLWSSVGYGLRPRLMRARTHHQINCVTILPFCHKSISYRKWKTDIPNTQPSHCPAAGKTVFLIPRLPEHVGSGHCSHHCWNYRVLIFRKFEQRQTKSCPYPRHKDMWGNRGIAPLMLILGTRWRWVVNFTPYPLCSRGKYPRNRWMGEPQSRSGRLGKRKVSCPCRDSNAQ
jgi:hypothetical protein